MANTALTELKTEVLDKVQQTIEQFQASGELQFPADYSIGNALKSAWLTLQGIVTSDKTPVLEVCTRPSVINALLSMAIQGLNPDKKQCYFIPYGKQLTLMRSYFGSVAVSKRLDSRIEDIVAEVIYEDDEFDYEIRLGKKYVTKHKQALGNVDKAKIRGAYAMIIFAGGEVGPAVIMTLDEIKQSWNQGQIKPVGADGSIAPNTTHGKFTAAMCMKTVINRICKPIINNSNDATLVAVTARQTDMKMAEIQADAEIAENANGKLL
jgi:recombination protein RecT